MHPILKAHIEKREFHHAYLLCGEVETCKQQAFEVTDVILNPTSRRGLDVGANPDFLYKRFGLFGINDSHNLTNWAATKSFSGQGKVFIMEVFSFNTESSNALLKTLEEPNEKTIFFIIVSSAESVLPTLRSRLTVINLRLGSSASKSHLEAELPSEFLRSLPNKRLEIVKKMLVKRDGENESLSESSINKQKAVQFLNALEFLLEKELRLSEKSKKASTAMEELSRSGQFISDKGASPKIILEHLALALPIDIM